MHPDLLHLGAVRSTGHHRRRMGAQVWERFPQSEALATFILRRCMHYNVMLVIFKESTVPIAILDHYPFLLV